MNLQREGRPDLEIQNKKKNNSRRNKIKIVGSCSRNEAKRKKYIFFVNLSTCIVKVNCENIHCKKVT